MYSAMLPDRKGHEKTLLCYKTSVQVQQGYSAMLPDVTGREKTLLCYKTSVQVQQRYSAMLPDRTGREKPITALQNLCASPTAVSVCTELCCQTEQGMKNHCCVTSRVRSAQGKLEKSGNRDYSPVVREFENSWVENQNLACNRLFFEGCKTVTVLQAGFVQVRENWKSQGKS